MVQSRLIPRKDPQNKEIIREPLSAIRVFVLRSFRCIFLQEFCAPGQNAPRQSGTGLLRPLPDLQGIIVGRAVPFGC